MTRVVDFEAQKQRLAPKRKAAKADALKAQLAESRQQSGLDRAAKPRARATKALLDIFKSPPKPRS